ncbi:MAG TPA: hypothetical protein VE775_10870, partial [Pyrinomonadaceae bacterium]|nr:hypothetical protein [Pyrinomonadaceae bacterium]
TEYQQRTLAPDAFLAVHGHVSECARCAARCYEPAQARTDYETLLATLTPAPHDPPYHLTDETAAAYVADTLAELDREPAETHLEVCAECAATIEQLRAPRVPAQVAPPSVAALPRRARTWTQLPLGGLWQLRPLQLAAAGLLLAVIVVAAALLLRARDSQPAGLVRQPAPPVENGSPQAQPSTPFAAPTEARAGASPDENSAGPPSPQTEPAQTQSAPLALVLNDGGQQITLDEQGNLAGLERLPEQVRRQVRSALVAQQLPHPKVLTDLNGRPSTLLGAGDGGDGWPFRLLAPLGAIVESDRPTFRWRPLAGADNYNVTVTDERLNEVATSGPLSANTWRVARPLARGETYSWQVTAHKKDGQTVTSPVLPAPQAKFQVLARTRLDELQSVRRAYPASHLTLGVVYAQAGLMVEAERELQAVVSANPQSEAARKLLRSVRAQRSSPMRTKPAQ